MLTTVDLRPFYQSALPYDEFVALGAPSGHDAQWHERFGRLALTADQHALVAGFTRTMHVLCLTGTWCGDCALQGAAMERVARANPCISLRFLLREERHAELIVANQINAGFRVPVTWFMAEDLAPVSRIGDRTLSRYRSMARKAFGPGAPVVDPPPADPVRAVLDEVLAEFERVHLLLRLSPRLRERHGD
jgi:hypothetical protein